MAHQNQQSLQFPILRSLEYLLKHPLSLGHQPPHTRALIRSLPLPPILWTPHHLFPHSQFKGDYQAAHLFWEVYRKHKQLATVSVCCISQTKNHMLQLNSSPFYLKPYEDWESQLRES